MRRPYIAGNWKMNPSYREAKNLVSGLLDRCAGDLAADVGVFPPFPFLYSVVRLLADSPVVVGAQNLHWEREGAYTGEVSAHMLVDLGCTAVIVGHSERRTFFGETNQQVNNKVRAALEAGLGVILCVGEKLEEREKGLTSAVVCDQLERGLDDLGPDQLKRVTIAYEPVWAIGTGRVATPDQAQEVHAAIRSLAAERYGDASDLRILYGGSVKPENAAGLLSMPDIDGALVGGASLDLSSFTRIVDAALQRARQ